MNKKKNYKQFEIIDNRVQGPKSTKKEETETKNLDGVKRPLWAKINKNDFDLLIQDVYDNLNNDKFKTTINKKTYDLKNAKKFLVKITIQKISEEDAKELYSDQITSDIIELKNTKGKCKKKRENILNVLENLESVYDGGYLHYKNEPS